MLQLNWLPPGVHQGEVLRGRRASREIQAAGAGEVRARERHVRYARSDREVHRNDRGRARRPRRDGQRPAVAPHGQPRGTDEHNDGIKTAGSRARRNVQPRPAARRRDRGQDGPGRIVRVVRRNGKALQRRRLSRQDVIPERRPAHRQHGLVRDRYPQRSRSRGRTRGRRGREHHRRGLLRVANRQVRRHHGQRDRRAGSAALGCHREPVRPRRRPPGIGGRHGDGLAGDRLALDVRPEGRQGGGDADLRSQRCRRAHQPQHHPRPHILLIGGPVTSRDRRRSSIPAAPRASAA